jgi:hypothetical protein
MATELDASQCGRETHSVLQIRASSLLTPQQRQVSIVAGRSAAFTTCDVCVRQSALWWRTQVLAMWLGSVPANLG